MSEHPNPRQDETKDLSNKVAQVQHTWLASYAYLHARRKHSNQQLEILKGTLMYKRILSGLVLFGAITVLLAACAIVDTSTMSTGPTVHMGGATFLQSSITIHKGDMLNLVDDSASPHIVVNGSWVGSTQKPAKESGAPTVNLSFNGNDSGAAGPFTTAGTFHLYCTIHQAMNLTVVVQ
jgi:plastocyanin